PVPDFRAARAGWNLASHPKLFPALAVQAPRGVGIAQMTNTLLTIEKLEVVYHRAVTAVQGITLAVETGRIVALLGTNGAAKTTPLRAIAGFLGLDDARVTEGAINFKGELRRPHRARRRVARRGGGRAVRADRSERRRQDQRAQLRERYLPRPGGDP